MKFSLDEILFYGGIALSAVSALSGVICFFVRKIHTLKLNMQLEKEYGPRRERKKHG